MDLFSSRIVTSFKPVASGKADCRRCGNPCNWVKIEASASPNNAWHSLIGCNSPRLIAMPSLRSSSRVLSCRTSARSFVNFNSAAFAFCCSRSLIHYQTWMDKNARSVPVDNLVAQIDRVASARFQNPAHFCSRYRFFRFHHRTHRFFQCYKSSDPPQANDLRAAIICRRCLSGWVGEYISFCHSTRLAAMARSSPHR